MGYHYINVDRITENRYDFSKLMEWQDGYDPLNSYFIDQVLSLPVTGKHKVTTESGRPDLLSYNIYGDFQYWQILLLFNRFSEASEIEHNAVIKYPSLIDIEDLYFSLKAKMAAESA